MSAILVVVVGITGELAFREFSSLRTHIRGALIAPAFYAHLWRTSRANFTITFFLRIRFIAFSLRDRL